MLPAPMMMQNSSSRRSSAGLAIAAGLLPVVLTLACIPVPIGDAETSAIDPGLSGAWVAGNQQDIELWILRPYDRRTWLVTGLAARDTAGHAEAVVPTTERQADGPAALLARMLDQQSDLDDIALYKAWLTVLGGRRFLCLEPLTAIDDTRRFEPPSWLVMRADALGPDVMALRAPVQTSPWDAVKSREEAEELLRSHADRDEFFDSASTYVRVSPSAYGQVGRVLKRAGLAVDD
jgi:hypothetical protein